MVTIYYRLLLEHKKRKWNTLRLNDMQMATDKIIRVIWWNTCIKKQ